MILFTVYLSKLPQVDSVRYKCPWGKHFACLVFVTKAGNGLNSYKTFFLCKFMYIAVWHLGKMEDRITEVHLPIKKYLSPD